MHTLGRCIYTCTSTLIFVIDDYSNYGSYKLYTCGHSDVLALLCSYSTEAVYIILYYIKQRIRMAAKFKIAYHTHAFPAGPLLPLVYWCRECGHLEVEMEHHSWLYI